MLSPEWVILPRFGAIGIQADHFGMTKFKSSSDPAFQVIAALLSKWVEGLDGRTRLHRAAANGHEDLVKLLLATRGVEADSKNRDSGMGLAYSNEHSTETRMRVNDVFRVFSTARGKYDDGGCLRIYS